MPLCHDATLHLSLCSAANLSDDGIALNGAPEGFGKNCLLINCSY